MKPPNIWLLFDFPINKHLDKLQENFTWSCLKKMNLCLPDQAYSFLFLFFFLKKQLQYNKDEHKGSKNVADFYRSDLL